MLGYKDKLTTEERAAQRTMYDLADGALSTASLSVLSNPSMSRQHGYASRVPDSYDDIVFEQWKTAFHFLVATEPYRALSAAPENAYAASGARPRLAEAMAQEWGVAFGNAIGAVGGRAVLNEDDRFTAACLIKHAAIHQTGPEGWVVPGFKEIIMLCLHQAGCEDEFNNGIFRGHLFADSSLRQPARLHIDMEINEGILALAEGHVGSITALQKIMDVATQIDPHSTVVNGIAIEPLMWADTLKLYGDKTHRLMERLCHGDPERAATVIKGYTRGLYTVEQLHDALKDDGEPIDVDAICNRVADLIPGYVRLGGGRGTGSPGDHLDNKLRPR